MHLGDIIIWSVVQYHITLSTLAHCQDGCQQNNISTSQPWLRFRWAWKQREGFFFFFFVLLQNQSSARMFQTGLVSVHTHVSRDLPICCGCCGLHPPFRIEPHIPQLPAVFVQNDNHMRLYFFSWFLYKFPFPNY